MKYCNGGRASYALSAFLAVFLSTNAFAVKNYFEISESEMRMLPKFCKTGFSRYKMEGRNQLNHLCPGLNALNHAKTTFSNNTVKRYAVERAVDHFNYTLGHTESTFFHSFIFLKRGEAYELSGDRIKALSDYQQALTLKPKNITVHIALIDAYIKLGDLDRAREFVKRGLAIKPTSKSLLRRKAKIH